MAPGKEMQAVVLDIRNESKVWDAESDAMGEAATKAEALSVSRIEAGLFQVIYDKYHVALEKVVSRSREGKDEMASIANALRKVAKGIEEDETTNEQQMRNLQEGLGK